MSSYANVWSKLDINVNMFIICFTIPKMLRHLHECIFFFNMYFCINILPNRHRIDDEINRTTATFYILIFFVVGIRKNRHYNWHSWRVMNNIFFPRLGEWSKIECAFLIWHQWSLSHHYISISGLLTMIHVQLVKRRYQ